VTDAMVGGREAGAAARGGSFGEGGLSRRDVVPMVALGVAYFVAARIGLIFALVEHNVTPIWPPTGIAVVAFLVFGRRLWPAVLVAALLVNAPISATWWAAIGTAVGNTLAPLVAATLLRRIDFRIELDRTRDAVALVGLGALVSMAVSATVGTAMLVLSDTIASSRALSAWFVWWAGDAMGVLLVAPFLFAISTPMPGAWTRRRRLEAVALAAVVVALVRFVLRSPLPLLFLLVLPVGFAAWRFQLHGAAPAALIVCAGATWAASAGRGPFVMRPLLEDMVVLQAFNASLAAASFVFAAVVADRVRAREELERAAPDLERRVRDRTAELTGTNRRLEREIAERERVEARLRSSERLLSQAQELARVGSYRWDMVSDDVRWSDELFRIHGHEPGAFPVNLETALAQVVPEDRPRIQANVANAIERRERRLPDIEYRIERPDGDVRVVVGSARLAFDADGRPLEMVGSVHDVTEQRAHEREHRIAETLQRALLPQEVRPVEGVAIATRYLAAEEGAHAGGDWYDVIDLPDGRIGFVIGDVSGHGIEAGILMGMTKKVLSIRLSEMADPVAAVKKTNADIVKDMDRSSFVTVAVIVFDPAARTLTSARGGHNPPMIYSPAKGGVRKFESGGLMIGMAQPHIFDAQLAPEVIEVQPGDVLLLYTDGIEEGKNPGGEEFGLNRIEPVIQNESSKPPSYVLGSLFYEFERFAAGVTQEDDLTAVCVKFK